MKAEGVENAVLLSKAHSLVVERVTADVTKVTESTESFRFRRQNE